jgi:hypothetical protein
MPYVKMAGQGALGDQLIKGKEIEISSFFQVKPKPLPKGAQGRPWKTPSPPFPQTKKLKSHLSTNNGTSTVATILQRQSSTYLNYKDPETAATLKEAVEVYVSALVGNSDFWF